MGVSGMGIPWHQTDPVAYPELPKNNNDTLAWISGPAGETGGDTPTDPVVPNFTRKDHNFAPGQRVNKQLVFINDARDERPLTYAWHAKAVGKTLGEGRGDGALKVGEKLFVPIEFAAPDSATEGAGDGTITLTAKIGDVEHTDTLAFATVAPEPKPSATVVAFDPVGDTTKFLTGLGFAVRPWTSGPPAVAEGEVLVVGRHALSERHLLPGGLADYIRNGGRAVVFGQDNDWLRFEPAASPRPARLPPFVQDRRRSPGHRGPRQRPPRRLERRGHADRTLPAPPRQRVARRLRLAVGHPRLGQQRDDRNAAPLVAAAGPRRRIRHGLQPATGNDLR
jgi:hypothetical protein